MAQQDTVDWRAQYLRQRTRSRAFLAAAVVMAVLFGGSVVVNLTVDSPAPAGPVRENGPMRQGGANPGALVSRFFTEDGQVDRDAVEQFRAAGRGTQFLEPAIENAVTTGTITREQADELLAALKEG
ncbi:MAG: hypothetical protein HOV94_00570 [Saccharothrix sp.]|nr:hypothetical protein [Saccharothrix sp.]